MVYRRNKSNSNNKHKSIGSPGTQYAAQRIRRIKEEYWELGNDIKICEIRPDRSQQKLNKPFKTTLFDAHCT